jgi:hypothetical protein
MRRFKKKLPILRAAGVVTAVVIIVSGVTFAALQSQQDTLTGNTIETATANLQLSTDGTNYSDSHSGFDFNNIVPGGQSVPTTGYPFYLKNSGGTPLSLKLAVSSTPANPNSVDLSKVNVLLTPVGTGTGVQTFTLQSLIAGSSSGGLAITSGNLASGVSQQFKLQVSMASDAVSGSGASLGNIDFSFSGTAVSN